MFLTQITMEKLKYAQDLIKCSTSVGCGFNMFINGNDCPTFADYGDKSEAYARMQGYDFAKKMAQNGEIAFTHKFKCGCGGYAFQYGGFWVCNKCGNKDVDKDWWKIRVVKDGNQFCCHGLDFEDLQSSDNYSFGETFEKAIANYEQQMLVLQKH
jgi:hypothetical protein